MRQVRGEERRAEESRGEESRGEEKMKRRWGVERKLRSEKNGGCKGVEIHFC